MDANMACVKFGLITEETDVEELVTMVQNVGKEVQESSKVDNYFVKSNGNFTQCSLPSC